MKCLFVHDHTGHLYNGKVYTEHFSYEMWKERYLKCFEEVFVLAKTKLEIDNPEKKMVLSNGDNVSYLEGISSFAGPFAFFDQKIREKVRSSIQEADVVILRLDSFLGLIASRECKKQNKPYLIEVAGCAWDSFWNHGILGKIIAPSIFLQTRKAIKDAPFVVYVTRSFLQRRYPNHHYNTNCSNVILPDDINYDDILERRLKHIDECKKNDKNNIVIGTTAHYDVKYKGQDCVIKALAYLKKKGIDNVTYELVGNGNGNYLKKVAKKYGVSDQVVFKGAMPHKNVMEWLDTIDMYFQPSKQEGLPRSVIEAMSRGVAVFGAKTAGIPELIEEQFLFDNSSNNYIQIASLIQQNMDMEGFENRAKKLIKEAQLYRRDAIESRRRKIFNKLRQKGEKGKKSLVLCQSKSLYFFPYVNDETIDLYGVYKSNSFFSKVIRRFNFVSVFAYGDWKKKVNEYNNIIIYDSAYNSSLGFYLKKTLKQRNVIVYSWNSVLNNQKQMNLIKRIKRDFSVYSFDKRDCELYDLEYAPMVYSSDVMLKDNLITYDVVFLGAEKNRIKEICKYFEIMKNQDLTTVFKIYGENVNNIDLEGMDFINKYMPYEDYLDLISKSKAIFDLPQEGQEGNTIRVVESMFFEKKLLTTKQDIDSYDFYNPDNIFIFGKDDINCLKEFIDKPYVHIDDSIKEKYDFHYWVKNLRAKK